MGIALRWILMLMAASGAFAATAQGGMRLIIWNIEPILQGSLSGGQHVGLGYDHDLNERISMAVQARYALEGGDSWVVNYRSAFHFSDNSSSSVYMGPMVGLRQLASTSDPRMLVPLGFRIGLRGGLEGFFADLHAAVVQNIGAGSVSITDTYGTNTLAGTTFCVGLDLGWGWSGPAQYRR